MNYSNSCCPVEGNVLTKVLPALLIFIFVLGVFANGLALWVFCYYVKSWKSSTVFLFNLALADFLLLSTLPFRATYYLSGMVWTFGDAFCRISLFMLAMNRLGSIIFLTVIAVDRYLRVVYPHHHLNSMTAPKAACVAAGLWVINISLLGYMLDPKAFRLNDKQQCESFWICRPMTAIVTMRKCIYFLSFCIPLSVILFCTARIVSQLRERQLNKHSKIKRALCFIIVVVFMFVVCFLPSNVTQLVIWTKLTSSWCCQTMENLTTLFYITISLTYMNSMMNPVVYYFCNPTFKRIYNKVVRFSKIPVETDTREDKTRDTASQTPSQLIN
ncbi:hydroxycarboxylic acid receptor 2-like [Chanos chanos]|uniref:Hydroxycarboxylic acid receptor 2-like n=1 Tax=Chanos chanos TaxID=29144 RepID=A0A6J2X138_CHACN|nr:hydroxycarboxylic acid receptor 2-like [Chanos chanos]